MNFLLKSECLGTDVVEKWIRCRSTPPRNVTTRSRRTPGLIEGLRWKEQKQEATSESGPRGALIMGEEKCKRDGKTVRNTKGFPRAKGIKCKHARPHPHFKNVWVKF